MDGASKDKSGASSQQSAQSQSNANSNTAAVTNQNKTASSNSNNTSASSVPPNLVADEMFPDRYDGNLGHRMHNSSFFADIDADPSGSMMDLAPNEKFVHADFFNDFEDLCDDEKLDWFCVFDLYSLFIRILNKPLVFST